MYAVETIGLTKAFRDKRALDSLDMRVPSGEIYGLVGRNGSGKSTAMKIICGMMPSTSGEVRIQGKVMLPCEASPRVGSLVETPGIYPSLSAIENMMSKALTLGTVDARHRCSDLLEMVGLEPANRRKVEQYSMGMKQRLGLALALLGDPDILLLDEPLNGLDPEGARSIRDLIVDLNRVRKITVIISSHVLDQLERICHRYGVIKDGRMVKEITSEEMEEACRGGLLISCSEPDRALALFSEHLPKMKVSMLPDGVIRIDGDPDASAIGALLMEKGISVSDMHTVARDVEEFFVDLMRGKTAIDSTYCKGESC